LSNAGRSSAFRLSRTLGLEPAVVGLVMSVGPVVAALAGVPAGRLVDRWGPRRMTIAGLIGIATGCFILSALSPALRIPGYVAPIVVVTADYALFQAANNTAIMTDISPDQRGAVSGMLNLSRNLGLITGASVMGAVYAATGLRTAFAVAGGLIVLALTIASVRR